MKDGDSYIYIRSLHQVVHTREDQVANHVETWDVHFAQMYADIHLLVTDDPNKVFVSEADGENRLQIGMLHRMTFGLSGVTLTFIDAEGPTRHFPFDKVLDHRNT